MAERGGRSPSRGAALDDRGARAKLVVRHAKGSDRDTDGRPVKHSRRRARATELDDPVSLTRMADDLTPKGHSARALGKAEKLYRRAFRLGYLIAAENLAAVYLNLGRHRDAVRWYRRAEAAGASTASLEIARAELYGLGTRRDARSAFTRLQRLARQRLGWNNWLRIEAMHLMADALMNGWLVRRSFARAEALLRRAAALDPSDYDAAR